MILATANSIFNAVVSNIIDNVKVLYHEQIRPKVHLASPVPNLGVLHQEGKNSLV